MVSRHICTALVSAVIGMVFFTPAASSAETCVPEEVAEVRYVICTVDPKTADLRMFWKNDADEAHRTFTNIETSVKETGKVLTFAINAGMFAEDFTPIGLFVEDGRALTPVNTRKVTERPLPNFYRRPNGIFLIGDKSASILTTEAYEKTRPEAKFATQSGPMLVIDGKLHPDFIKGSTDRTRRSGVGTCRDGMVRFAITDGIVNFHDFASLFRDHLKCDDALFLDGGRGVGLFDAATNRKDWSGHGGFGPVIGLVEPAKTPD